MRWLGLAGVLAGAALEAAGEATGGLPGDSGKCAGGSGAAKGKRRMLQDDVELQHYERIVADVRAGLDP